jgi:Holliday junction resolvase RusA-like endonuclease
MIYEFEIPGKITGKARPRVNTNTGIAYTPAKTKDYEQLVVQYFWLKYQKSKPIEGRVKISIIAYFGIPKGTSKKDKELMLNNTISPTKKPDIDNITKIILDSLNTIAFKDDNQVTKIDIEKLYSENERVYVRVEEY